MFSDTTRRAGAARLATNDGLLRFALKLDGTVSVLVAAISLLGATALEPVLGLPAWLHWSQGAFLGYYATALWYAATRPVVSRSIAVVAVLLNAVWAVGCAAILTAGPSWFPLTRLGVVFVASTGVAVIMFGSLQYAGLRRAQVGGQRSTVRG